MLHGQMSCAWCCQCTWCSTSVVHGYRGLMGVPPEARPGPYPGRSSNKQTPPVQRKPLLLCGRGTAGAPGPAGCGAARSQAREQKCAHAQWSEWTQRHAHPAPAGRATSPADRCLGRLVARMAGRVPAIAPGPWHCTCTCVPLAGAGCQALVQRGCGLGDLGDLGKTGLSSDRGLGDLIWVIWVIWVV